MYKYYCKTCNEVFSIKEYLSKCGLCHCDIVETVLGHMCEGLYEFQLDQKDSCAPGIARDGYVYGCDATNNIPISYCPFCGIKLESL